MNSRKKFNSYVVSFRRRGLVHYAIYEIVVMAKKSSRQGKVIDKLGFFNPQITERMFYLNTERLAYWVNAGAQVHMQLNVIL